MTSPTERLDLAPDTRSVRAARTFVATVLRRWGLADAVDTAVLLTSELATNAVRHASTRFAVVVTRTAAGALIDVLDGVDGAPERRSHDPDSDNGRGLHIVSDLATSWGTTPADQLYGYAKGIRFSVSGAAAGAGTRSPSSEAPSARR